MAETDHYLAPLRYPSKDFDSFERWVRHFEAMATANGWDDERQRRILPTCLNNFALDEYFNLPTQYREQVNGQPAPTIQRLVGALNSRIGDFPSGRSARAEFKALQQKETESIQEFSRRVRKLGEAANGHLGAEGKQEANKDAFMDGLLDSEIRYTLLKEDPANFNTAIQRALALDSIARAESVRLRNRRTGQVRWSQAEVRESRDMAQECHQASASQTETLERILDQQSRQTEILQRLVEQQARWLDQKREAQLWRDPDTKPKTRSESPSGIRSGTMCFKCHEYGHYANKCTQVPLNSRRPEQQ